MPALTRSLKSYLRALLLVVLFVGLFGRASSPAQAESLTLVVDNAGDTILSGCSPSIPGNCTLREAIQVARAHRGSGNTYHIQFAGSYTITLSSSLPQLDVDGLWIDGTGHAVTIDGAGVASTIFYIAANGVKITHLTLYGSALSYPEIWISSPSKNVEIGYNVIGDSTAYFGCHLPTPDNTSWGIYVTTTVALTGTEQHAWIYGNMVKCQKGSPGNGIHLEGTTQVVLGSDPSGQNTWIESNRVDHNAGYGIYISGGGAHSIQNSRFTYNDNSGIYLTNSSNNAIFNNLGSYNLNTGLELVGGSTANRIGCAMGGPASDGNDFNGNGREGIYISGPGTTGNTIYCNRIGIDRDNHGDLGNHLNGVAIVNIAHDNNIGLRASEGNTISGNGNNGVTIEGGANHNLVTGNKIGVGTDGTSARPNRYAGVNLVGAGAGNIIGVLDPSETQIIAANLREGVYIDSTANTTLGSSNRIGLPGTGMGNQREGVRLVNASNTLIMVNSIRNNGLAGIAVEGDGAQNNAILFMENYGNGGLPMDLGNDGPTSNGGCTESGPNGRIPFPVITSAQPGGSGRLVLRGTSCPNTYLEIMEALADPRANGGGGKLISLPTTPQADASGLWSLTLPANVFPRQIALFGLTGNNSSEISPAYTLPVRPILYLPFTQK